MMVACGFEMWATSNRDNDLQDHSRVIPIPDEGEMVLFGPSPENIVATES